MAQSAEHTEAKAMARQYALILAEDPADAAAHLGYIRALEALQRWPDAAAAIGLARRLLPDLSDGLRPQHVNALYRAQRLSEAVLVQQEIAAACPGDLPAQLRLGRLLLQARSFGAAAEVYGRVQAAAPAGSEPQAQALLGRLNALSRAGDWHKILAETAAVLDAAVSEGPPERLQVLRYRARALRELGQVEAAAQVLTQTLAQPSSGAGGTEGCAAGLKAGPTPAQDALELRLHLALLYAAKGDLPGAAATFDAVLAQDPSHGAARLGRADVALRQDDPAQAMAILEAALLPGSDRTPPRPPRRMIDRQRVINRYVSLALQAGDVARLEAALPALGPYLDRLSEPGLAGLLRVIEQAAPPELTRALLSRLLAQDRLSLQSATYLVELALRSAGAAAAQTLEQRLVLQLAEDQRRLFRAEAALLQKGPELALQAARAPTPDHRPRSPVEAAQLGQLLLETGHLLQAMRYLRRAARHWPQDRPLKERLFNTYLRAGAYEAAEALLPQLGAPNSPERRARHLRLLFNAGRLPEVEAFLAQPGVSAGTLLAPQHAIRLYLALGRLPEAEALIPEVVRRSKARSLSKFMVSQNGAMINEQRLWESFEPEYTGPAPPDAEQGPYAFYYPAKCVVDAWMAQQGAEPPAPPHATSIPPHVMQYWNTPAMPPGIAALMDSWRAAPELTHTRLDRRGALQFLDAHLGEVARRAFLLANNVAEECDFLRLAWLFVRGGIYADADDKRVGPLAPLLQAGGDVVVFRENVGSIANNVLMARPGHPLIEAAMGMAQASLLARENDNTWAKTGPGLITRAVAGYLEGPHRGAGLRILPKTAMHVAIWPHAKLPHKATDGHWNTAQNGTAPALGQALQEQLAPFATKV